MSKKETAGKKERDRKALLEEMQIVDSTLYQTPPRHHGNNLSPSDVEYNSGEGSPYNVGTEEEEEQDEVEPSADKSEIEEAEEHSL